MTTGNDIYTGYQLREIFGMRMGQSGFKPMELAWVCPVDKTHRLSWSEFNKHVYCHECEKDYFTLLCPKSNNPHTDIKIYQKELKKMAPLMNQWTLKMYRGFK